MTAKFYMNRGGFVSIEKDGVKVICSVLTSYSVTNFSEILFCRCFHHKASNKMEACLISPNESFTLYRLSISSSCDISRVIPYYYNLGGHHSNLGGHHSNLGGHHSNLGSHHSNLGSHHSNLGSHHSSRCSDSSGLKIDWFAFSNDFFIYINKTIILSKQMLRCYALHFNFTAAYP